MEYSVLSLLEIVGDLRLAIKSRTNWLMTQPSDNPAILSEMELLYNLRDVLYDLERRMGEIHDGRSSNGILAELRSLRRVSPK